VVIYIYKFLHCPSLLEFRCRRELTTSCTRSCNANHSAIPAPSTIYQLVYLCACVLWSCVSATVNRQFSPSVRPHNPATRFRPPSATVVSAEPFLHGTGTLRCRQKEMATYRHWSVSLWRDPDDVPHCRILSADKTEWRLCSATLCGWRCCFVADQLWFMTCIREEEVNRHICNSLCNVLLLLIICKNVLGMLFITGSKMEPGTLVSGWKTRNTARECLYIPTVLNMKVLYRVVKTTDCFKSA